MEDLQDMIDEVEGPIAELEGGRDDLPSGVTVEQALDLNRQLLRHLVAAHGVAAEMARLVAEAR